MVPRVTRGGPGFWQRGRLSATLTLAGYRGIQRPG